MRIQMFFQFSHTKLGADLNAWLAAQACEDLALTADSSKYGHMVTVLYEPTQAVTEEAAVRVEAFFRSRHDRLEGDLNDWLSGQPGKILALAGDSNEHGHLVIVLYEPGATAAYEALVLFHERHDGLTAKANATVEDRTVRFMVQGTNNYGYMLVFLVDAV